MVGVALFDTRLPCVPPFFGGFEVKCIFKGFQYAYKMHLCGNEWETLHSQCLPNGSHANALSMHLVYPIKIPFMIIAYRLG